MTAYPGYVHLCRLLGRENVSAALGLPGAVEPGREGDPDELDEPSRARLRALFDGQIDGVAMALVDEAAASDDVTDGAGAVQFIRARIAEFGDLLTDDQVERLTLAIKGLTAGWG
jgi:hypothetical protein